MFGDNPIRKPEKGSGYELKVQSIFPTLQGEGIYTGWPSVFLRLGGCNLACRFCDTEFESFTSLAMDDILEQIKSLAKNNAGKRIRHLVVITGGEPFRQPIQPICKALIDDGFDIQIETNGTLYHEIPKEVDIVCSPKSSNGKYYPIREDILQRISAFKFIVSKEMEGYQAVEEVGQSQYNIPVYIQPMDEYNAEKNQQNMEYTVNMALEQGYRLSLQTHKIINVE